MKTKILNLFVKEHGTPDNYSKLEEYIDFLLDYKLLEDKTYTEKHHILDRASFPQFKKSKWNIVELDYLDHIYVHELLFEAYNIRRYQRTLNFKNVTKDSEMTSKAAKKAWKTLKSNSDRFDSWKEKRITYLKSLPSSYYSEKAKLFWDNITENEYITFCEKVSKSKTEEVIQKQKDSISIYYSDEKNRKKKSIEAKERWDNIDDQKRDEFKVKMKDINSNISKRKDASQKLKNKWKEEEFLEKMRNRKSRPKNKYELIFENGTNIVIVGFSEMIQKYNLNPTLVRKFMNTNQKVKTKSRRESALNTVGLIINQI